MSEEKRIPRFVWKEFLEARQEMIAYFHEVEGKYFAEIVELLSLDFNQCALIYQSWKDKQGQENDR